MKSLQKFESGEELSDEQLMSINGGDVTVGSSSDLGAINITIGPDGIIYHDQGSTGSSTTSVGLNGITATHQGTAPFTVQLP